MKELQAQVEKIYDQIRESNQIDRESAKLISTIIKTLDCGGVRVAEKIGDEWHTHAWLKKAILLAFKINSNKMIDNGVTKFYDKMALKFSEYTPDMFKQEAIRVVPQAIIRQGAYVGRNVVLMPSYVNVGAYIGDNTMIDTWATIGSCAQIGNNVHISGGVGIGGVLEPLQNNPTIIEDDCFIGARSEIVEGVIIGQGSVVSMGVYIGQSTKIYNRETKTISYGYVPPYSVVVSGNIPNADKTHSTYAAIIVKQVDAKTKAKVSINDLLRE